MVSKLCRVLDKRGYHPTTQGYVDVRSLDGVLLEDLMKL